MLAIKFVTLLTFLFGISASTVSQRGPTGLKNRQNICYMNALISSLYDVTPFRMAVYAHFEDSVLVRALAGVFARKQLNLVSALDLERDFMATISHLIPDWQFGQFQDIDEFFKTIFPFLPNTVANSIGFNERQPLSTDNGDYIINEGVLTRNPMVTVHLPERPVAGLKLQDLVHQTLSQSVNLDYTINREEHLAYFDHHQIHWSIFEQRIQAQMQPRVFDYANVVPVFIARRTRLTGSAGRDFRTDRLEIPESLILPLQGGGSDVFTLVSFAVYHPGHYLAYTKAYPSAEWFVYNDESVIKPNNSDIMNELQNNAVMIFYVKRGTSLNCPIPEPVEKWSITSLIIQHMRDRLVPRIKKLVKRTEKEEEEKKKSKKK